MLSLHQSSSFTFSQRESPEIGETVFYRLDIFPTTEVSIKKAKVRFFHSKLISRLV